MTTARALGLLGLPRGHTAIVRLWECTSGPQPSRGCCAELAGALAGPLRLCLSVSPSVKCGCRTAGPPDSREGHVINRIKLLREHIQVVAIITLLAQTKEMYDSVILLLMPLLTPRSPPPQGGARATCHTCSCHSEQGGPVSMKQRVGHYGVLSVSGRFCRRWPLVPPWLDFLVAMKALLRLHEAGKVFSNGTPSPTFQRTDSCL